MEPRKMDLFIGQQWRYRHREQIYGHGAGGRRRWVKWREYHGDIYTTICRINSQWEFAA